MLTTDEIRRIERKASALRRKYDTTDPFELADWLGILVDFAPHPALLAFTTVVMRTTVIGCNARAQADTRRCAVAHELGHVTLGHLRDPAFTHRHFCDLNNVCDKFEAPANLFAASLLLPRDYDVVEALHRYGDVVRTAQSLFVCPELLLARLRMLNAKGFAFPIPELPGRTAWRGLVQTEGACESYDQ